MSVNSAGSMITSNGKLLLLRRSSATDNAGLWNLPGGRLKEGETPKAGCLRETYEETGILPFPEEESSFVVGSFAVFPWRVSVELDPDLNDESDAYGWFTPEEVSKLETVQGMDSVVQYWIDDLNRNPEVCFR